MCDMKEMLQLFFKINFEISKVQLHYSLYFNNSSTFLIPTYKCNSAGLTNRNEVIF